MARCLALCALLAVCSVAQEQPATPAEHWETCSPDAAGLDAAALEALRDFVGGRGCVVRHGRMAYSWGDVSERADVASAAKPVYSYLLLRALEDGRIGSLDDPVARLVPGLVGLNPDLGHKDAAITWRHLANQISCYGVSEHPGCAFDYNDWQMALFIDTLFGRVYGAGWAEVDDQVLGPLLADPLRCEDDPTFLAFGEDDRAGRLAISVRDFARFGLLYLRRGRWGDRQLLAPALARMAVSSPLPGEFPRTEGLEAAMLPGQRSVGSREVPDNQCDHLGSYSWLWWVNGVDRDGLRHWPEVPVDTYGAFGHGGPRAMVVLPSLDLIVSWNDGQVDSREKEGEALSLLAQSVRDREALGQVAVHPDDARWFGRRGGEPVFLCGPGDPEGFLYRGAERRDGTRDGDQSAPIGKLATTGANCIYMAAVRSHGGDGDATEDPFVGHDPARGLNEAVLGQWDGWLTEMDAAGISAFLILYDDSARVWDTGDEVAAEERAFVRGLVGRLAPHKGMVWCVAEEAGEALSPARIRALAAEIRAADTYGHPIAVHLNHGLDFREFADDPNIDQFAVQYNVPTAEELHAGLVEAVRTANGRYNVTMAEAADWGEGPDARRKAWACALAGAYSMALGMDIEHTPLSDLEDCGRLVAFMEQIDLRGMRPHDELADGDTQYVLARPDEAYVVYSSRAASGLGLRDLPAGSYWLRWLDCATGQTASAVAVHEEAGPGAWPVPEGLGPEVALEVRRM
jgi:hypothetical protein